jgi:MSHA biogenesis protein MshI
MSVFFSARKNRGAGRLAVAFDVDGVRVAHVAPRAGGRPEVDALAFFAAPDPYTPAVLARIARELQSGADSCSTLLAPDEYRLLVVDAPGVPQQELRMAVRWRLKDMLDFPVDDAVIDVIELPVGTDTVAHNRRVMAVAARNQLIGQRQALFAQAKIPLSVIDIPEMAQRNMASMVQPAGRAIAMLSIDAAGGLLTITHDEELYLSRRIDVPLMQCAHGDSERRNACHDTIAMELQRSFDHLDRHFHALPPASLVLAPLPYGAQALQEFLSSRLYLPADILDLGAVLDLSKVAESLVPDSQHRYFMVLGAALRDQEQTL